MRRLLEAPSIKLFLLADRLGVHILPKHFYTPIPDHSWLSANREAWIKRASLIGVDWDLDEQLRWIETICTPCYHEVARLALYQKIAAGFGGLGFGQIESQVLHCFIRSQCPARIIEIGSGFSTFCMLHAARLNEQEGKRSPVITSIEPYPSKALRRLTEVHHIKQPCQVVPFSVFEELQAGDLLFIDSTHSVKVGSDVIRIYLDLIPRLKRGVFIHAHDIYLPYLYPRDALKTYFGAQETALVLALLTNNRTLRVLACLSALHYDRPQQLSRLLTDYRPQAGFEGLRAVNSSSGYFPSSLWLQTAEPAESRK